MGDVQETLAERGKRYGDFADHAKIAQAIKAAMYSAGSDKWGTLPDMHKQALETIADKIARILNGDPNYPDNWHDIQGYARLVEERLPGGDSASLEAPVDTSVRAGDWVEWNGGGVVPRGVVEVELRCGERITGDSRTFRWERYSGDAAALDIDRYRHVKEPRHG